MAINLKMLSESLGLSQTTVSRALNGFLEVSQKTRERVLEAANRLNYQPSQSAASLATGRSRAIGHVVPISTHNMINPHFADFVAGAGEEYARLGYDMVIRVVDAADELQVYRDLAQRHRVDGLVIHGPKVDDPRLPLLESLKVPFVVHGRSDHYNGSYSWLDVDNRRAFHRATRLLTDLGHRRIALINGIEDMNFAARRRQGFEDALADAGITPDPALMYSSDMIEPYGHDATVELLSLAEPATAIVTSSILPALGVVRALAELGLRSGRDVSILTYDDCLSFLKPPGLGATPYFTSVRSSIHAAGAAVARMLIDLIEGNAAEPVSELWEAELVIGQTTGPVTNRP